jgi:acetoin utilization deacetylase AcuC-like enzyme
LLRRSKIRRTVAGTQQNPSMQVFHAMHAVLPLPPGHRFPAAKYQLLRDRLQLELPLVRFAEAAPATDGELALAHSPAYIAAIATGSIDAPAMREIGFPWSPAMVDRSRRSVGATIAAARTALREGIAANLAGGTHHASRDRGGGFCVFNDAAVAARLLQAEHARMNAPAALPVAIVDLDVHQGNGTAAIFRDDPTVFTLSLHGAKNFPFRKEPGDLDIELPDGCRDDEYLQALDGALAQLDRRFEPRLAIYLAGADPHEGDRLGRLKLTWAGLQARDARVLDWAWRRRIALVLAMAGGYGTRIEDTVQAQVNTFALAVEHWQRWQNPTR